MTITERIAAAIKPILDEDRRADRERIAELERSIGFLNLRVSNEEERANDWQAMVADLNKQLDELTEKCAALVVENKRLREDDEPERKPLDVDAMNRALDAAGVPPVKTLVVDHAQEMMKRGISPELARAGAAFLGAVDKTPSLRIDPDMSDPQPGKLLVVRLEGEDSYKMQVGQAPYLTRDQFVGFLVETPAVEVKEQGPWVVWDDPDNLQINPCMGRHGWGKVSEGIGPFDARSDAVAALNGWVMGGYSKAPRVITLAEARAIEAKR